MVEEDRARRCRRAACAGGSSGCRRRLSCRGGLTPRNLRTVGDAPGCGSRRAPIATANTDEADERDAPRAGRAASTTISRCGEQRRRRTRRTRPRRSSRRRLQCLQPTPTVVRGCVRASTSEDEQRERERRRGERREIVDARGTTACADPAGVWSKLPTAPRTGGRRPRSRRSSSRQRRRRRGARSRASRAISEHRRREQRVLDATSRRVTACVLVG